MTAEELKGIITAAFDGVTLSGGVSLHQAEVMDNWGEGCSEQEFARLPDKECTTNWLMLPREELERYALTPYLDPNGFRYYIPAFMCSVIDDPSLGICSGRLVATLGSLYPKHDSLWAHKVDKYAALSDTQKQAIAAFLDWMTNNPAFDQDDRTCAERAVRNYWGQYRASPLR
jgi:hypothetical protein